MKKIYMLLLTGLVLVGCQGSGEQSRPFVSESSFTVSSLDEAQNYSVEFYGWGDEAEIKNYQTLINAFMLEYPNIAVSYNADNASSYMTNLRNRANNLPDIFYMPDTEFLYWADTGKLLNMRGAFSEEELGQLWPEAVDKYYYDRNATTLGESAEAGLYGIPKDLGPFTLVCNKTLLKQLANEKGVTEQELSIIDPDVPMSWNQFTTLLKKLDTNPNDDIFGVTHYEIEAAVYSNNADFFNADQSQQTITSPNFVQAMQWIADLTLQHHIMPNADQQKTTNGYQRFFTGKSIFSFAGPWDLAAFWPSTSFEFDVYPVPYGPASNSSSTAWVGSMSYSLSKNTKSPDAALLLAKYLCYNEQAQRQFYDLGQQVPNITEMAYNEYIHNPVFTAINKPNNMSDEAFLLRKENPSNRSVFVDTIDGFKDENDLVHGKARSRYYTYRSEWYDDFLAGLEKLWSGQETAQQTMNRLSSDFQFALEEMIGEYRQY
ncbi:MAG: extracellular solute-binding protein [Bacillales bacterium]|jgi:multiple sugar transport system substrate-binding protein|nr:extracellular solute-binding protein [Bacillales bacterium]